MNKNNVGAVHGNIRTASYGNTHIGAGKRGCVVDAVAYHSNVASGGGKLGDFALLVLRKHFGDGFTDAKLPANGARRSPCVSGEHNRFHVHLFKGFHSLL